MNEVESMPRIPHDCEMYCNAFLVQEDSEQIIH